MKKILFVCLVLFLTVAENYKAQLATDSWAFGFGFRYPRFINFNNSPLESNYGGFISLQRNFSEHVGIRIKGAYSHLESQFSKPIIGIQTTTSNFLTGDLDFLYYLAPCEVISPYIFGGLGGNYRMLSNYYSTWLNDNGFDLQFGFGFGGEFNLFSNFRGLFEFDYRVSAFSEIDGNTNNPLDPNAKDTYLGINLGLQYYFNKGEPSKYCQLYSGLSQEQSDLTDYNRIEEMIKAHIPKEITKEIVVEKPVVESAPIDKWVLVGVNFASASAKLTADSYPILYDAAKTLLKNPEINVAIEGHTDNVGSENYNQSLSEKRAQAVKNYLISKGVSAGRLTTVGLGETNPVADNKTADGRAINRRIEFKVR